MSSATSGSKYTGVAYDLNTHEIVGEASGQLNGIHGELTGNLRVNGMKKNMNKVNNRKSVVKNGMKQSKHIDSGNQSDGKDPAKMGNLSTMTTVGDGGIGGYLQKDGNKTGFSLTPKRIDTNWEQFLAMSRIGGEK
ncbi:hypothetical protein [Halolamina salifodinae]|uniref:Uncharacterized protein n=1 Tax=Halolamina salifodinae TaxID=1202767 RepID=A0A8T4H0H9_9EURY|nr:hypothetical protein [Halolamina salifodinae]MBP1987294.1 hypothetical protein [Halolamina salifodinae]